LRRRWHLAQCGGRRRGGSCRVRACVA
jgi:hypothetical protein